MPKQDVQAQRDDNLAKLLDLARRELRKKGTLDVAAWRQRYPKHVDEILELLGTLQSLDDAVVSCRQSAVETLGDARASLAAETGGDFDPVAPPMPAQISRYQIRKRLGQGGMGTVYRATTRN